MHTAEKPLPSPPPKPFCFSQFESFFVIQTDYVRLTLLLILIPVIKYRTKAIYLQQKPIIRLFISPSTDISALSASCQNKLGLIIRQALQGKHFSVQSTDIGNGLKTTEGSAGIPNPGSLQTSSLISPDSGSISLHNFCLMEKADTQASAFSILFRFRKPLFPGPDW